MVRRGATARAFGDAWVFPGGVVGSDDQERDSTTGPEPDWAWRELTRRGGVPPVDRWLARGLWRAALRELFEEAGILFARDAAGRRLVLTDDDAPRLAADRDALRREATTLDAMLAAKDLTLDPEALQYYAHWITPEARPRRFDTRFFVAAMPPGQAARHCGVETVDGVWIEPHAALGRHAAGDFQLVLPTRMHLQRLSAYRTLDELLADAATKPIRTVLPGRPATADDGIYWGASPAAPA